MASKKSSAKGSKKAASLKAGSPQAFIKDMQKLLKKHGIKATVKMKASNNCPEGFSLKPVSETLPNGDTVIELKCVKD